MIVAQHIPGVSNGQQVQTGRGPIQLDASLQCLSEDQPSTGSTRNGPICLQANPSVATILQLETRPTSRGSGCLPTRLEQGEGLCQSPLVSDRPCPQQNQGSDSPSLEESGLAPSNPGDADGLPSTHSSPRELVTEGAKPKGDGHNTSTSCLACLREKYRTASLSTEASDLVPASWRTKSSQTYDSLFKRWASWCSEKNHNPISVYNRCSQLLSVFA